MMQADKFLIFLCSGAAKAGDKKLSYRIARQLEAMGIANIGTLENLSEQHSSEKAFQKNMLFLNDCRSGCVNVFTHGFEREKYLYVDISPYNGSGEFDIPEFIQAEMLPKLADKWDLIFLGH
jgi:uncharacterized metal-binding protein